MKMSRLLALCIIDFAVDGSGKAVLTLDLKQNIHKNRSSEKRENLIVYFFFFLTWPAAKFMESLKAHVVCDLMYTLSDQKKDRILAQWAQSFFFFFVSGNAGFLSNVNTSFPSFKMVSTMPATSVSSLPPLTSMLQPGSIQLLGPFRLHVVLKQGRDLAAKDSCGRANVVQAKH